MSTVLWLSLHWTHIYASSIEAQLQNAAGNTTILKDTGVQGWTDGPSFRGTASILWSCLVTIVASIYTAIHPNIPVRRVSRWKRFGYKMKWVLIALLVPEFIIGRTALRQYRAARRLVQHLNKSEAGATSSTGDAGLLASKTVKPGENRRKYSMAYGFWVEMGGFVLKTSEISHEHQFVALTAKGAIRLAEAGYIFDISDEQIADRSKTNALGKLLVCFQVFWMLLQCITKASVGYPLTLLEIHTMVHVFFAICMYCLWWHKPLDVNEPVEIDGTDFMDILSLLMISSVPMQGSPEKLYSLRFFSNEFHRPEFCQGIPGSDQQHVAVANDVNTKELSASPQQDGSLLVSENSHLSCGLGPRRETMSLGKEDIRRWCLFGQALLKLEHPFGSVDGDCFGDVTSKYDYTISTESTSNSTTGDFWTLRDSGTWSTPIEGGDSATESITGIFLLPLVYSGIHLSAISTAKFPSVVEAMLWYICAGTVGGLSFVGFSILLLHAIYIGDSFTEYSTTIIALVGLCVSQLCRSYLVVESFISLRDVPLGAFATTPWLQAVPHL